METGLMALIKCPECGKEISNRAPACIHCGFPLNEEIGGLSRSSSNSEALAAQAKELLNKLKKDFSLFAEKLYFENKKHQKSWGVPLRKKTLSITNYMKNSGGLLD